MSLGIISVDLGVSAFDIQMDVGIEQKQLAPRFGRVKSPLHGFSSPWYGLTR